jgi:acetyl-CoA C-acetyltransferase
MKDVVIAGAARTPIGTFNGALSGLAASELGTIAISEALNRAKTAADEVSEVVFGQVLTAAAGMNPARQAAINAGIPVERTAYTINQVCGSGLRAVANGWAAIQSGDSDVVVAGGQENMSLSPHAAHLRNGHKMGDVKFVDTMIKDGLWDVFNGYHMGNTAENVAERWQITREQQDAFALGSQNKAEAAQKAGRFKDEIVPVTIQTRKGETVVDADEHPRHGTTIDALAKLRPAFAKDGTVTAGNASGINDGAAAVVLMEKSAAVKAGLKPMARLVSYGLAGVDPKIMGIGPVSACQKALAKAGLKVEDMDVVESNEAFAVQALAVSCDLKFDPRKTNPNGGAVALGHPIGATGAVLTVKALYELQRIGGRYALVTMCIGGGQGIAGIFERMH